MASPTFVFRLIKFDKDGVKQGKRKYGYASKTGTGSDLDESVYNGIISRAEQAFGLLPGQYQLSLILTEQKTKELGASELDAGTPFLVANYAAFRVHRNVMAALVPDAKNRKVVNLCITPKEHSFQSETRREGVKAQAEVKEETKPLASTRPQEVIATAYPAPMISPRVKTEPVMPTSTRDPAIKKDLDEVWRAAFAGRAFAEPARTHRAPPPPPAPRGQAVSPTTALPAMPGAMPASLEHPGKSETTTTKPAIYNPRLPPLPNPHSKPPVFGSSGFADYATGYPASFSERLPTKLGEAAQQAERNNIEELLRRTKGAAHASPDTTEKHDQLREDMKRAYRPSPYTASSGDHPRGRAARAADQGRPQWCPKESAGSRHNGVPAEQAFAFSGFGQRSSRSGPFASFLPRQAASTANLFSEKLAASGTSARPAPSAGSENAAKKAPTAGVNKYDELKTSMDKFVCQFNDTLSDVFGVPMSHDEAKMGGDKTAQENVFTGVGEKESGSAAPMKKEEKPKHKATCDSCSQWIVGIRHKCLDCPDWDCCETCFSRVEEFHPGHSYALIRKQGDIVWSHATEARGHARLPSHKGVRHIGIHCDSCQKPIFGIRYKCAHPTCPDFDLCAECESDPVSYATGKKIGAHDYVSHPMLKMRTPVCIYPRPEQQGLRAKLDQVIKNLHSNGGVFASSPKEAERASSAASAPRVGLRDGPTGNDKTLIVDVDVPFALPGGQTEVSIPLDLGKNEKGETVILGFSGLADAVQKALATGTATKGPSNDDGEAEEKKNPDAQTASPLAEDKVEIVEKVSAPAPTEADGLNATWIEDVTFDDGSIVSPGTEFNKIWKVVNSGDKAWPEGCHLLCISGLVSNAGGRQGQSVRYPLPQVKPGDTVDIVAQDIVAPQKAGAFMAYYRLSTANGSRFGDRLWIDVNVEEQGVQIHHERGSSDNSLHSSTVVTPTLSVKHAGATPDFGSAVTSPRTTESDLPAEDGFSMTGDSLEGDDDFVLLSDEEDFRDIDSVSSSKE